MKRLMVFTTACILLLSFAVNIYAAPEYGSEWSGMTETVTSVFSDVDTDHWAHDAIASVVKKNWFNGYPDGTFRPNASITRAEALKVFVVFLGLDYQSIDVSNLTYSDIHADDWYAAYVEAGKDLFPVHTTIQGKTPFNPEMPVTREDTIYALVKALGCDVGVKYPDLSVLDMFDDSSSISGSVKDEFAIALEHQLVSGFPDGTIRAQNALTRAEFATLLLRGTEHGFHDTYVAKIESVSVIPATPIEMTIGETVALSARSTYTDGTTEVYSELSPYDASVNGVVSLNGTTITALKEGTAVIKYNDSYLKDETLTIVVKKPTEAPTLKLTDYDEVTENAKMSVKGTVTDKNGTVDLTCNGKDIAVNSDGSFTATVSLSVGINNLRFVATNMYGVEAVKTIEIERTEVEREEQSLYIAYDAYALKNGSTPWSWQHATIGLDDYENLEFIDDGWYHEFYQNWAQGSWPFGYIKSGKIIAAHAGSNCDPVLTFTAPRAGQIQIPSFVIEKTSDAGDGVRFQILKNNAVIFPENSAKEWEDPGIGPWEVEVPDIYLTVEKGDKIYFRVNMRENQNSDGLALVNYQIKYL